MPAIDTALLRIIKYPDPRLRATCKPVATFDASLPALAKRMLELMHDCKGVGLAAPQVGLPLRLFVCNPTGEPSDDRVFVNPRLEDLQGLVEAEEGCLSIPEVTVDVRRAESCTINAHDLEGHPIEARGTELVARCWQHECDHLDGRLIIDQMSETDKIANRRVLKTLEAEYKHIGQNT